MVRTRVVELEDNKEKPAADFKMCVIERIKTKVTYVDDDSTFVEDLDLENSSNVSQGASVLPYLSRSALIHRIVYRGSFQRWLVTISQLLVCILAVVFGIAQFSNLVDKPLFCANVGSFDEPSSVEVAELKKQNQCLAAPGLYHLGDQLFDIIDDEHFALVLVQWSTFNINSVFNNIGSTMSEELRLFIALVVASLAARSCWQSFSTKIKLIIPWHLKRWYKMPCALFSHIAVENMVKLMIFGTLSEIILQLTKFLYIGGFNIPILGRVDEVASRNVISYLASAIGINFCMEGFCWSIKVCNNQFGLVQKPILNSILIFIDMVMDVLYLCTYFVDIGEELVTGAPWYDYLVCLSESSPFLYFTILFPIFRLSGAIRTLDDFWCVHTLHVKTATSIGGTSASVVDVVADPSSWKSSFFSAILAIFLLISMVSSGIYLIVWTESHLADAAKNCDNARFDSDGESLDYGLCFKGERYPFEPIEDYESPNGEKLYCDCKYSVISYYANVDSAFGFIYTMRSLRWVTWISPFQALDRSLKTKPNLQLLYIYFVWNDNTSFVQVPYSIDISASRNLHTIWIDFNTEMFINLTIKTAPFPKLEVFFCNTCTLVDFDPCESPNLKNLRLEYSTIPPLGPCFADLSHLEAFIVKNTYLNDGITRSSNIHCQGKCLQELPELPPSLVFLILNQQNITEISDWEILADIEMVSLWGNPVCGIYNLIGDWRNLTGKAKYCTMMSSASCVKHFQDMVENCDRSHPTDPEDWLSCRWNIVEPTLNGSMWSLDENCTACERDVEYSYLCDAIQGCSPIAFEVDGVCAIEANQTIKQGCDHRWVDERSNGNSFFACDTACLDLYPEEDDDCQAGCSTPSDMCSIWWSFAGGFDGRPTVKQAATAFGVYSTLIKWNNYDDEFKSMNNSQRFQHSDIDKDGIFQGDAELFHFVRNIESMAYSEWGYENRWRQQTCSHCNWYKALTESSTTNENLLPTA